MEAIKDVKGINTFAAKTENDIHDMKRRMEAIHAAIRGGSFAGAGSPREAEDAKIGKMFKAIAHGNKEVIGELGARGGSIDLETKADLGTPLTGSAVTGSYLVPREYYDSVMKLTEDKSALMPEVMKYNMTSNTLYYPRKNAGATLTKITTDGGDNTESNPTFATDNFAAYTYATYVGVTEQLLEDSLPNLGAYIRELFSDAAATTFDNELLNSASAPTGLFVDTGTNAVTMSGGDSSFDDIEVDDLRNLEKELATTRGALKNAKYIMSPYVHQVLRDQVNANGDPLIAAWIDAAPLRINGRPIILSYDAPDSSDDAASTAFVALGNPANLIWGSRLEMEVKFFDMTSYAVTNTEVFFRCRVRWGFDVGIPASWAVLSTAA